MFQYRELFENEIDRTLFNYFHRKQIVTKCWRKEDGKWMIKDVSFIDDWSEQDYEVLIQCLRNTAATGGFVYAAFIYNQLKGFVSVENKLFGGCHKYLDLSSIHVSEDVRNQGIGANLFREAQTWAKKHGAKKLYISAHSAIESQAFYKKMGCIEAKQYQQEHVDKEPYDCQLECEL